MLHEIWKPVAGYEELYEVSNFGMVKSLKFSVAKILKPLPDKLGYLRVALYKNRVRKHTKLRKDY